MFMFIFISSCVYNILCTDSFILQDTYNVLLKDSADYKVDLTINGDDYEMIDKKQLKDFIIDDKKKKFNDLDELALEESIKLSIKSKTLNPTYEASPPIVVDTDGLDKVLTTYISGITAPPIMSTTEATKETVTDYNYDDLLNEYYQQVNESQFNNAYHISKSATDIPVYGVMESLRDILLLKTENPNCTHVKGIGLVAVKCLIDDYNNDRISAKEFAARFWSIFQIWFLVYLAVAVPLWCTRGWCCCCLCCKFFKPRQTIEEAKKYVILYPPGVYKTKNGNIYYEPSEREKECYEEFDHFIKTL